MEDSTLVCPQITITRPCPGSASAGNFQTQVIPPATSALCKFRGGSRYMPEVEMYPSEQILPGEVLMVTCASPPGVAVETETNSRPAFVSLAVGVAVGDAVGLEVGRSDGERAGVAVFLRTGVDVFRGNVPIRRVPVGESLAAGLTTAGAFVKVGIGERVGVAEGRGVDEGGRV